MVDSMGNLSEGQVELIARITGEELLNASQAQAGACEGGGVALPWVWHAGAGAGEQRMRSGYFSFSVARLVYLAFISPT